MSDVQETGDEQARGAACACRAWWKVAVVVGLAAAVAGVFALKAGRGDVLTHTEGSGTGQAALPADNPLASALATGRPVVVDFGGSMCMPCKMMEPIMEGLKKDYAGRAEVLLIDGDRYPAAAEQVGVDTVPTQVFFNSDGKEVHRHQGFMPRENIVAKLAEMGVQ